MRWQNAIAVLALVALAHGLAGCGSSCSASNCSGCCDSSGTCQLPTNANCGINGAACVSCTGVESCESILGTCVFSGSGSGNGSGNGGTTSSPTTSTTGTSGTTTSGTTGSCSTGSCTYDTDCGGNNSCYSNCCLPTTYSCEVGSCEYGTCGPGYDCDASTHCCEPASTTGSTGTSGSCSGAGVGCVADGECCSGTCGASQFCCVQDGEVASLPEECCSGFEDASSVCQPTTATCTFSSDCEGTFDCIAGNCEPDSLNPNSCESGSCIAEPGGCGPGSGYTCDSTNGCCTPVSGCAYSTDCIGNETCVDGVCTDSTNSNAYCNRGTCAGGCGYGFTCDSSGDCCMPDTSCTSEIICSTTCSPGYTCQSGCCISNLTTCTAEDVICEPGESLCCGDFTCQYDSNYDAYYCQ